MGTALLVQILLAGCVLEVELRKTTRTSEEWSKTVVVMVVAEGRRGRRALSGIHSDLVYRTLESLLPLRESLCEEAVSMGLEIRGGLSETLIRLAQRFGEGAIVRVQAFVGGALVSWAILSCIFLSTNLLSI